MNDFPTLSLLTRDAQGRMAVDGILLQSLAEQYGTPLFVYSKAAMLQALLQYQRGFAGRNAQICYAVKANSNLAVLQVFAQAGCGFDIVSGGELQRALAAGAAPHKIIFSGVGKSRAEMRQALAIGIGCFNVESIPELHVLSEVACAMGVVAPISLRVNPNVDAGTHPYISTGLKDNKFGIAHDQALAAYQLAASLPGLRIQGIDCHIGSQITQVAPYLDAMQRMLDLVELIESHGIALPHFDFGGGLGICYTDETPPAADTLWQQLLAAMDARGMGQRQLQIEPGRSLVGNAGVCLTQVAYVKHAESKNFCIVDAAMNDLPRPAMYEAYHRIEPVAHNTNATTALYDVVGPVCESGDWLGRDRQLAVAEGDYMAVLSAGAYCSSMSSNYNTRPRAAEVLIADGQVHLIAERETPASLWAREKLL